MLLSVPLAVHDVNTPLWLYWSWPCIGALVLAYFIIASDVDISVFLVILSHVELVVILSSGHLAFGK